MVTSFFSGSYCPRAFPKSSLPVTSGNLSPHTTTNSLLAVFTLTIPVPLHPWPIDPSSKPLKKIHSATNTGETLHGPATTLFCPSHHAILIYYLQTQEWRLFHASSLQVSPKMLSPSLLTCSRNLLALPFPSQEPCLQPSLRSQK